jgi:hypothetical protein
MRLRLSQIVGVIHAAVGCVFASLLAVGVSAAAAGSYYIPRPPVTVGNPSTTAVAIGLAVVLGIELAIIVLLTLPRRRRAASARIEFPATEEKPEQTRKAA